MDIYNKDAETNALTLYSEVCVQIIEANNLKTSALHTSIKVCDMHIKDAIEEDKKRDPLMRLTPSFIAIKKVLEDSLYELLPMVSSPEDDLD